MLPLLSLITPIVLLISAATLLFGINVISTFESSDFIWPWTGIDLLLLVITYRVTVELLIFPSELPVIEIF